MHHHTRVDINLRAYRGNLAAVRSRLGERARLCAVVKADAYGHGLDRIAPAAIEAGADCLGIVDNWEAACIRQSGIERPVMRLRPALEDEAREAAPWKVEELVGSLASAEACARIADERGEPVPVHVKLDAGIGRMGLYPSIQHEEIMRILKMPGLNVRGVMTHFPNADDDDERITLEQLELFLSEVERYEKYLPDDVLIHTANSAATLRFSQAHRSMVRAGICSYGLRPDPQMDIGQDFQPVMRWSTRVVMVHPAPKGATIGYGMTYAAGKDTRIALLPAGYADGYLRDFSNRAPVLIRGRRYRVSGRVSMNLITVDVGDSPVQQGDEAVLMGRQGGETIAPHELSVIAGTIDYELACLIGKANQHARWFE